MHRAIHVGVVQSNTEYVGDACEWNFVERV